MHNKNEFESLMKKQVYTENEIMEKIANYFEKEDRKNTDRYYSELYKEFDELYRERILDDNNSKDNVEDINTLNDEELENIDDEELDEKVIEDGKEYTRRQLLYKELYKRNLKKYYELRKNIHKQDIREDGDISFNDYNFKQVLQYEMYLRRLDFKFKSISSNYITEEFEDVNEELNEYVSEEEKYNKVLSRRYDKQLSKIDELNNKLDEISDKIELLNPNDENYKEEYNLLMDSYTETVAKIHLSNPNILELKDEENRKKDQDDFISKKIGVKYKKDIKKTSYDIKNFKKDKEDQFKDKKQGMYYEKDNTRSENEIEETLASHIQVIKSNIENIKTKLKNKDYKNLEQLIEDTNNIINIYHIDKSALEKSIDIKDINMLENIDVKELIKIDETNKENNKDAVEKDEGFLQELGFVAGISEMSNYKENESQNNEREIER